jgi:N utilization substance protein B
MTDPRHQRRAELLQKLFACTFIQANLERSLKEETEPEFLQLLHELEALDTEIRQVAPERPLTEINKIDLAILRLIVFESKHTKTPKKVLLDEAVELAKEFGSEGSSKFINGALARLLLDEAEQAV